MRIAIGES